MANMRGNMREMSQALAENLLSPYITPIFISRRPEL